MTHRIWGGFHGRGGSSKQLFANYTVDPSLIECWTSKHRIGNPYFEGQYTLSTVGSASVIKNHITDQG